MPGLLGVMADPARRGWRESFHFSAHPPLIGCDNNFIACWDL